MLEYAKKSGRFTVRDEGGAKWEQDRSLRSFDEPIPLTNFPCYSALHFVRRASWPEHSQA
jgi:hypothetical protein